MEVLLWLHQAFLQIYGLQIPKRQKLFAEAMDESARDPERVPSASVIPLVTNIDEIRKFMTVRTGKDG